MKEDTSPALVAARVRAVWETQDLDAFRELLAPDAHWGAPDAPPESGCRNRDQVLAWWSAARGRGVSGRVTEVLPGQQAVLVGMFVTGSPSEEDVGDEANRWQVFTLRDGLITDIRGFEDRDEAARRAGI